MKCIILYRTQLSHPISTINSINRRLQYCKNYSFEKPIFRAIHDIIQKTSCIYVQYYALIFQLFCTVTPMITGIFFPCRSLSVLSKKSLSNSNNETQTKLFGLYDTPPPYHKIAIQLLPSHKNWNKTNLDKVVQHFV